MLCRISCKGKNLVQHPFHLVLNLFAEAGMFCLGVEVVVIILAMHAFISSVAKDHQQIHFTQDTEGPSANNSILSLKQWASLEALISR